MYALSRYFVSQLPQRASRQRRARDATDAGQTGVDGHAPAAQAASSRAAVLSRGRLEAHPFGGRRGGPSSRAQTGSGATLVGGAGPSALFDGPEARRRRKRSAEEEAKACGRYCKKKKRHTVFRSACILYVA